MQIDSLIYFGVIFFQPKKIKSKLKIKTRNLHLNMFNLAEVGILVRTSI